MPVADEHREHIHCEGADMEVELALWTHNQPQSLAVCDKPESSPARHSNHFKVGA
jgi:hypothetical protein